MTRKVNAMVFGLVLLSSMLPFETNAQVLETEEFKPLLPKLVEIGAGLKFQTSKEGTETALPIAWEYGKYCCCHSESVMTTTKRFSFLRA